MDLKKLAEPFDEKDIEWRIQASGKNANGIWARCLAYIDNRAIMDRLDEVCGIENWSNEFLQTETGFLCGLGIRIQDNQWVWKWDGAEATNVEAFKGGLSSAMKRCAVQWGMGRYLYNLEAGWAEISEKGKFSAKTKDGEWFKWNPPALPDWALPKGKQDDSTSHTQTASDQVKDEFAGTEVKQTHKSKEDAMAFIKSYEMSLKKKEIQEYWTKLSPRDKYDLCYINGWIWEQITKHIETSLEQQMEVPF